MSFPGFDAPAYGNVGGALPFANSGSAGAQAMSGAASGNVGQVAAGYQQAYNNALAMNQSNYNNILRGYQQSLAQHSSAEAAISAGYSGLYNDVIAKVSGIGQARANDINAASARALASGSQQLIDRGLGNSTVQSSLNRGVESDRNRQLTQLSDDQARMVGDYMSQLGLAGLSNRQYGLDASTAQLNRQLDFMNSVTAKYPDANLYGQLAAAAGYKNAANQPFTTVSFGGGAFGGGGPGPKLGYVPGPGPYEESGAAFDGGGGATGGGNSWLMDQYAAGQSASPGWNVPNPEYAAAPSSEQFSENYGAGGYGAGGYEDAAAA